MARGNDAQTNCSTEALEALRKQLLSNCSDPILISQDGGQITNPIPSSDERSHAMADAIASLRNGLMGDEPLTAGFKPVDKCGVAGPPMPSANGSDTVKSDEEIRKRIVFVDSEDESLSDAHQSAPDNRHEWYKLNPQLQKAEIQAMADIHPDAKMGYLPNGKMYWIVRLQPVVCSSRKDWTLLAIYDSDHPTKRWSGSVKFYPVKPNYQEMMEMVNRSSVTPKRIPHLLRDENKQIYLCTISWTAMKDGTKGGLTTTAATLLRHAMVWITKFELGLIDQETWTAFQGSQI